MSDGYAVTVRFPYQVGIDAWETVGRTRIFPPTATLAEVDAWVRKLDRNGIGIAIIAEAELSREEATVD